MLFRSQIRVNNKRVTYTTSPSAYVAIKRLWKKGDVVQIMLPMRNTLEHLTNAPEYVALLHGPILLGAKTGTEGLKDLIADDSRWGHIASGERLPIDKAPIIIEDAVDAIGKKLVPIKGKPLSFTATNIKMVNSSNLVLEPFYRIHDARYMMYWMALTGTKYQSYLDSIAGLEKEKLALQKRTLDFVAPGEQQPEVDHALQSEQSRKGSFMDEFWRDASNGGYFSYQMATNGETNLNLRVRYWGAEWGSRKFDIYIDEAKLISENNTGRWHQSQFQDIDYAIPASMLQGKTQIRVKFQAAAQNTAGAVYYLRLLRKN